MNQLNDFISSLPDYLGIFLLMFSTFLIGYIAAWVFQRTKYQKLLKKFQRSNAPKEEVKSLADIDTIFTEIKPKIIEVVKETTKLQQEERAEKEERTELKNEKDSIAANTAEKIVENARMNYINYTKSKPKLNFDNFGHGSVTTKDDLTKINGIGPYIEQRLNEIGIYNYDQISKFQEEDIMVLTELIDFFPGRIERDSWVAQAEALKK